MDQIDKDFEQLMALKDITNKTGILHEAQVLQLKAIPILYTNAIKSETLFNFDDKKVIFNIKETKGKPPKQLKQMLKMLTKHTQVLLGDEYSVVIKLRGKVIFKEKSHVKIKQNSKSDS